MRRRYQPRIVSGLATHATSESNLRPSRLLISASVRSSESGEPDLAGHVRLQDPGLCDDGFALKEEPADSLDLSRSVTNASSRAQPCSACRINMVATVGSSTPDEYFIFTAIDALAAS